MGSPFAMPGIYRPQSFISLERWLAAHYTTNISESKHTELNIDGRGLTLVGGIMVGLDFDARALAVHHLSITQLLHPRYREATPQARAIAAARRRGKWLWRVGACVANN